MGVSYAIDREDLLVVLRLLTPVNRLVVRVAAETGLRISDVLSLSVQQFYIANRNNGYVTVLEKKTHKKRRVHLSVSLRRDLLQIVSNYSPFLFCNRLDNNKPRTRQAVWKDLNRAAKALRFDGQISPHSIRKMAAMEKLQASGGDPFVVSKWLCHSDMAVTAVYLMAKKSHIGGRLLPKKRA